MGIFAVFHRAGEASVELFDPGEDSSVYITPRIRAHLLNAIKIMRLLISVPIDRSSIKQFCFSNAS